MAPARKRLHFAVISWTGFTLCLGGISPARAQEKFDNIQRDQARTMLREIENDIKKHYYDPKLHGIDVDARFREADQRIQAAHSLHQSFGIIAGALDSFNDSHLFFLPPQRALRVDYGYGLEIIGNKCFVTSVRPESDAATKLKPGDEVEAWMGYAPTRENFSKMQYYYYSLSPQLSTKLLVRSPEGQEREVEATAKTKQSKKVMDLTRAGGGDDIWQIIRDSQTQGRLLRYRYVESKDEAAMIWKLPIFDLEDTEVDHVIGIARKHKSLIVDLRGNPGGSVETLERLVGDLFDHDLKIADRLGRKEMKPQLAKSEGGRTFSGKLIVLIDSQSASAAELLARVVQLEHRGTVIGDRSAGAVMEARHYPYREGTETVIFYGASITDADLIMSDGKSLEHTGVTPDEVVLPSAADLAEGRDPALSRAAALVDFQLSPEDAGKMFPVEWAPF